MLSNPPRHRIRSASTRVLLPALLVLVAMMVLPAAASAANPVPLRSADVYAVLAGTTVTNTGPTIINGDLGLAPGSAITGFPPGFVNGATDAANTAAANAKDDLTTAYLNAAGQQVTATVPTQLGGTTRFPGVYDTAAGELNITGTLTLDAQGDPDAIFIFKAASTLVTAAGAPAAPASQVNLINGARSCNVFWQVGSSATLGTYSVFRGNILALTSIAATTGAVIDGRLLARNGATTLDSNTVTRARCDLATPTLTIGRVPSGCIAKNFKLNVKVSDPTGIDSTSVYLDGKRVKRSSKGTFSVKIPAKNLGAGQHKIRVVATDNSGNTRVRRAAFQRCERAAISFTG